MSYAITSTQSLTELTSPEDDDVIPISETSVTARATDGVILNTALGRLTSASAPFLSSDTGKFVTIPGAGSGGADHVAQARYISATTVALTPPAITAVASADFFFAVTKKIKFATLRASLNDSGWDYTQFEWSDASPISLGTIGAGKRIVTVTVTVSTAFNGTGASITIGTASDTDEVLAASQTLLSEVGTYETHPGTFWGSATALRLTLNAGVGASAGEGLVSLQIED